MSTTYILSATLIANPRSVAGLRIEAWDSDGVCPDLIDVAVADERGNFEMRLERDYVAELLPRRRPAVVFRVFDGDKLIPVAQRVVWPLTAQKTEQQIPLAETSRDGADGKVKPAQQLVRGTTSDIDGRPLAGRTVRAFDRNLERGGFKDTEIGQARTDGEGRYEIRFRMPTGSKVKPDLIVRLAPEDPNTPPLESELMHDAPATARVDLGAGAVAAPQQSEFKEILERLAPVLRRGDVELAELDAEGVEFAARAARIQPNLARLAQQAVRLHRETNGVIPTEIFYGLCRMGHAGGLETLGRSPLSLHRKRIKTAIARNIVSATFAEKVDAIVAAIQRLVVTRLLSVPDRTRQDVTNATLSDILATSLSNRELQTTFLSRWFARTGTINSFWAKLRKDPVFAERAAQDMELTLRLAMLFEGHLPALSEMRRLREAGRVRSLRELARWEDADWQEFLLLTGVPPGPTDVTIEDRTKSHLTRIQRALHRVHPTERLRTRARRARDPIATSRLRTLLAANPGLDPRQQLPDEPAWGDIPPADQDAARAEWTAFRREALTFRHVPAPTLLDATAQGGGRNPVREAASRVLSDATDLDLERESVEIYLARKPGVLNGVAEIHRGPVVDHLKATQRVLRIIRKAEAVEPLMADGLDSAFRIARVPAARFVERYSDLLGGEVEARRAHTIAARSAATTQIGLTTLAQTVLDVSPWAVRGGSTTKAPTADRKGLRNLLIKAAAGDNTSSSEDAPGAASWPVLFGEQTWCACTDCQSAYGPAAYFVDLLHMLDEDGGQKSAADWLFERRRDLEYLKLSCANTNTTLPYIDLVNEVLETYIATRDDADERRFSYDSGALSAEELRAVPQNVRDGVYQRLAGNVYPFTLPFHRPLAVVRGYLAQLGTSYRDVLDIFGPRSGAGSLSAAERVAAETLGLSTLSFQLIAGIDSSHTVPQCYGFDGQDAAQWETMIANVPELLARTGVSYEELVELVKTYFVNPLQHDDTRRVELEPPVDCKIDATHVIRATTDTWSRLHRFIRLQRTIGWSIADLDRAIFAVGLDAPGPILDRGTLLRLALIKRAESEIDRPLSLLLSLWSDFDTWGTDALYLKLFQSRAVTSSEDTEQFTLNIAGDPNIKPANGQHELADNTQLLANHVPTILAALRISEADLDRIWSHALASQAIQDRETATLTLHNLSVLHRYAVLAKGIGMRVADMVSLLDLTGLNPFAPGSPASTLRFEELSRKLLQSGFSVATLEYLFRHTVGPAQGPAPSDSEVLQSLKSIWAALRAVRHETEVIDDPEGALLTSRLALIHPPEIVASILDALDPSRGLGNEQRARILSDYLGAYLNGEEQEILATPDAGTEDGKAARRIENQMFVLNRLSHWLRDSLSHSAVTSVVAGALGLSDSLTRRLLVDWIPNSGKPAIATFLDLSGGRLDATYFDQPGLAGTSFTGAAQAIELHITTTSRRRGARWTGRLMPLGDGEHTFVLRTDGVSRLRINGQAFAWEILELDDANHAITVDRVVTLPLNAGMLTSFEIEYDGGTAAGGFELLWKLSSSTATTPVGPEHLFDSNGIAALDDAEPSPGHVWRRLHKAALLIKGLGLTDQEVAYLEDGDGPFAGFQLRHLPMTTKTRADHHMKQWEQIVDYVAVRRALPKTETTLVDVFENVLPSIDVALTRLCEASGWDAAAVEPLLSPGAVDTAEWTTLSGDAIIARLLARVAGPISANGDLNIGLRLAELQRCLELSRRTGVGAHALRGWAEEEPTPRIARQVVQAVRARYEDETQWLEVARTLNDKLREAQRITLVAHLLPRMKIHGRPPRDANELFEHFLIDVEMSASAQTSRIKQAISSVQLFVQRCLLGLEEHVKPDAIDAELWPWRKNYRVWEANRKILLYPENWIEPELRDGKSPFFEDLESELKQGPLDDSHVEQAFVNYLEKLDQVARLKICAVHWQEETDDAGTGKDIDILHVVARTPGVPAVFFYRSLIDGLEWTPWEKIDLDIETEGESGDVHIILAVHDRRLYLFWAIFAEKPEPEQPGATEGESPPPTLTHWEIRLAWSTYRDGRWSPRQASTDCVDSARFITTAEMDLYPTVEKQIDRDVRELKNRYDLAKGIAKATAGILWPKLVELRQELLTRILSLHGIDSIPDDEDWAAILVYQYLEPRFIAGLYNLGELEDWIESTNRSFERFLDDIYEWPGEYYQKSIDSPKQSELNGIYDELSAWRERRDEAKVEYDALKDAVDRFKAGEGALAIPSLRKRSDHTFWLSTSDGLSIRVVRHSSAGDEYKIGAFTLSADGRSIDAENLSVTSDISKLIPEHSRPRFNGFRVDTSDQKGLDLPEIEDLLGKANDLVYVGEQWLGKRVSLRPFFISEGADCHVALRALETTEEDEEETQAKPQTGPVNTVVGMESDGLSRWLPPGFPAPSSQIDDDILAFRFDPIYRFEPVHHPFVLSMIRHLNRDGIPGLLRVGTQSPGGDDDGGKNGHFAQKFDPDEMFVQSPYSPYDIDFRPHGAYALYNWELFFHAPFLIAIRLMQDQRYEEAQDWFHYIFDPTTDSTGDVPKRFWKVRPFRLNNELESAQELCTALSDPKIPADVKNRMEAQINQWLRYPANPHRIAALRTSAYQKSVVFRYIDNLIAWGDSLFARDTIESINEATQLYILASHLLGPRPERIPPTTDVEPLDYATLRDHLDTLSNLLVDVEGLFPFYVRGGGGNGGEIAAMLGISHLPVLKPATAAAFTAATQNTPEDTIGRPRALYFCVPSNDKLLGYWDTVDDRLFKIRHSMNIAGVERQLPLFEPPIDPALLVRAAAAGLDLASVLSDLGAPRGNHRFPLLIQKANELCAEVRSLGGLLLAALEKRDGEVLALLRATHEKTLLKAVKEVRMRQLAEAEAAKVALERTRETVEVRYEYYASREKLNTWEEIQLEGMLIAAGLQAFGGLMKLAASSAASIPDFDVGPTGMGAHATAKSGGSAIGDVINYLGEEFTIIAQAAQTGASAAGITGGHERRMEEWQHQAKIASKELLQIDQQLVAADIRIDIATQELSNQELQIENSSKVEEVLKTKYTNEELYSWMISKISEVYYQAYKLAYDMARRAERGYRYETGIATSSYIQFGYWDGLRKGLLAGEQLALDLRRLDAAYLEASRRELEITRQISLVLHNPAAFIALRDTGSCTFDLPEEMFDADYPGHYFRRLKSVSLTLPCVAGPYTAINCTLTQLSSRLRAKSSAAPDYPEQDSPNDPRFDHEFGSIQSIATSHGQNDSGMFEVNFRDDRYLPFEGTGAISRWRIDLPRDCNAFDFDTLSDVIMRISYTARDGGKPLATAARKSLQRWRGPLADGEPPRLQRLFRLRYELADAWYKFRTDLVTNTGNVDLPLSLDRDRFPFVFRGATEINIEEVHVFAIASKTVTLATIIISPPIAGAPAQLVEMRPRAVPSDPLLLHPNISWRGQQEASSAGSWTLGASASSFPIDSIKDLLLLVTYTVSE
ncbi:MAG: neuraminidase-like domain-containing protein [Acidobacteriota bacterium]